VIQREECDETASVYLYAPRIMSLVIRRDYEEYDNKQLNQDISFYNDVLHKFDTSKNYTSKEARLILESEEVLKL